MIVEINEIIDFLDDFLQSDNQCTVVGGIAGTQIEKIVVDRMTSVYEFNKILILNGVQDYIYFMKKPVRNVKFWADVFVEDFVPSFKPIDVWKPKIFQEDVRTKPRLDTEFVSQFDCLVVLNSQVMSYEHIDILVHEFPGRIVLVTDPCELNSVYVNNLVKMNDFPVVVDSMEKVSPIIALARKTLGFDTKAVEHRVKCDYKVIPKINKRTINKLDNTIYVTNDWTIIEEFNKKQVDSKLKKGQKVIVSDNNINIMLGENGVKKSSITYGTLLTVEDPRESPLMKHKIWNSKEIHACDITYEKNKFIKKRGAVAVIPANVMSISFIPYHRYDHLVFLKKYDETPWPYNRTIYTILKCSNNVTVVEKF